VQKIKTADEVVALAQATAESNMPGQGSTVVRAADVQFGTWDAASKTFGATNVNPTALRVSARRSEANGNALPLLLGGILGVPTADLSASATAILDSTCTPEEGFTYVSEAKPNRAAVVTMGEFDPNNPDRPRYLATPDHHPIIRVDSSLEAPALITVSINGRPDQQIRTPGRGSFWTALVNITVTMAANPRNPDVVLVHKVKASVPSQPFNAGSTATWNNNLRNAPLPGRSICKPGTTRTMAKLVG
jgi:hypothetical protein